MAGRRNPKRWVIRQLGKRPRTGYELVTASGHPDRITTALWSLEATGHIAQDPQDFHYSLTPKGHDTLMRIRRNKPTNVLDIATAKERLVEEFHGPHGLAIVAVEDDPFLSERLAIAISDGMPPVDLSTVSKYRRPQVVEEAVNGWRKETNGGPCSWCGTKTARKIVVAFDASMFDNAPTPQSQMEVTGFTVRKDGLRACAVCTEALASHTVDEYRDIVFNAVTGVLGVPLVGQYRSWPAITPFAHEVGYVGTAWGHLTGDTQDAKVLRRAMQLRAEAVVHRSRYARVEGQTSIPGIVSPAWANPPKAEKKFFTPLVDAIAAVEEQQAITERAAKKKADRERHTAMLSKKADERGTQRERDEAALRRRAAQLGVL